MAVDQATSPASGLIRQTRLVAILRLRDQSLVVPTAQALSRAGVRVVEFSLSTPGAIDALRQAREKLPDILLGVGTVRSEAQARMAIEAGAQFLVTPTLQLDIVRFVRSRSQGVSVVLGAFSPTEIVGAAAAGADFVKVFPASVLGAAYIQQVLAPMPDLPLIPTGGVRLENMLDFLEAGAQAVAIGRDLVRPDLVDRQDWEGLTTHARQYVRRLSTWIERRERVS